MMTEYLKATIETPIGPVQAYATEKGLLATFFSDHKNQNTARWSHFKDAPGHGIFKQTKQELDEYFSGNRKEFSIPLDQNFGTEFQQKVWSILRQIPFGSTISYKEQAVRLGTPKSVRAVAQANGKNPLSIIVPCHRVIASNGKLQGYAGGLDVKRRLLELEASA
jgi:methylated-DNA-[protein]-cysteine S-methyltransferase